MTGRVIHPAQDIVTVACWPLDLKGGEQTKFQHKDIKSRVVGLEAGDVGLTPLFFQHSHTVI